MRALVRLSNSSRKNTTFKPRHGEPSRRMLRSLCRALVGALGLEIAAVDGVERRLLDEEVPKPAAGVDHNGGGLGADVALGQQAIPGRTGLIHRLHAGHFREFFSQPVAVGLNLDVVAAAK